MGCPPEVVRQRSVKTTKALTDRFKPSVLGEGLLGEHVAKERAAVREQLLGLVARKPAGED
jgi:hypothetical protein